jgi:hypothetical protein
MNDEIINALDSRAGPIGGEVDTGYKAFIPGAIGRDAANRLDHILGLASTHNSLTVLVARQNLAQMPIRIRHRMSKCFYGWAPT